MVSSRKKFVLLGIDNPQSSDPAHALYPWPPNCAGWRLCRMMGTSRTEYLRLFVRRNLFPDRAAYGGRNQLYRATMTFLSELPRDQDNHVIAFGAKAAMYLAPTAYDYFTWYRMTHRTGSYQIAVCPHPSGRNRFYNDEDNLKQALKFLMGVATEARREAQKAK